MSTAQVLRESIPVLQQKYWGISRKGNSSSFERLDPKARKRACKVFLWLCRGEKTVKAEDVEACEAWAEANADILSPLMIKDKGVSIRYSGIAQLIGERGDLWLKRKRKYTARQSDHRVKQTLTQTINADPASVPSTLGSKWSPRFACLYIGAIADNNYIAGNKEAPADERPYLSLIGAMLCLKYSSLLIDGMTPELDMGSGPYAAKQQEKAIRDIAYGEGRYFPAEWADKSDKAWLALVKKMRFKSPAESLRQEKIRKRRQDKKKAR